MKTISIVTTPHGIKYTRRLCKHFAHKIPAIAEGSSGRIEFPFGLCEIECDDEQMRINVDVTDADEVERAERVVTDHLARFAHKEKPVVTWQRKV